MLHVRFVFLREFPTDEARAIRFRRKVMDKNGVHSVDVYLETTMRERSADRKFAGLGGANMQV